MKPVRFPVRGPSMLIACAVSLSATCGCGGAARTSPHAHELVRSGAEALERGELDVAEARLSVALEYDPRLCEALVDLGLVELARGNFPRARLLLERARREHPDVAQPHHALAVLRERQGAIQDALDGYRAALRVDPGFVPARRDLARLLFEAGAFEESRAEWARLTELAPNDPTAAAGHVEALLQLGRRAEADRVLAEALTRSADAPWLLLLEARRRLRVGQAASALGLLAPLESVPQFAAQARALSALARLATGDREGALRAAQSALAVDPRQELATQLIAKVLEAGGDPRAKAWRERLERVQTARGAR